MRYLAKVPSLAGSATWLANFSSGGGLRTSSICHAASSYRYRGLVIGAPVDSFLYSIHMLCEEEAQRTARRPGNDTRQPYSPAHCPQWESYSEIRSVPDSKHARSKIAGSKYREVHEVCQLNKDEVFARQILAQPSHKVV